MVRPFSLKSRTRHQEVFAFIKKKKISEGSRVVILLSLTIVTPPIPPLVSTVEDSAHTKYACAKTKQKNKNQTLKINRVKECPQKDTNTHKSRGRYVVGRNKIAIPFVVPISGNEFIYHLLNLFFCTRFIVTYGREAKRSTQQEVAEERHRPKKTTSISTTTMATNIFTTNTMRISQYLW